MKQFIFIIGLLFSILSYGQEKNSFFFDEFTVSINRTTLQDENTEDKYGFGLGAYHSFWSDKILNLVFGLEYNRISQFKKSIYHGHYAQATNVTYRINYLSIPIGLRAIFGSKTKYFIETGGFADLGISAMRTGKMNYYNYSPDDNNLITHTEKEFNEEVRLSNPVGLYLGIGVLVPISRFDLVVKPDYRFGINKLYSYYDDINSRYFRINIGLKIN